MWAILGGSGFEKLDGVDLVKELERKTPYGQASSGLSLVNFKGTECISLPRHGKKHELSPSDVNYRANIFALKKFGASKICSISSVGSLKEELEPGHMVVAEQYLDFTKGLRKRTFCEEGFVGHISLADPAWSDGVKAVKELSKDLDFPVHFGKTYICIEGPAFSTRAESKFYRQIGADIIGMTNCPEASLAREAGLAYLPLCFVTDYDCWDESLAHVTTEQVMKILKSNSQKMLRVLSELLASGAQYNQATAKDSLGDSLMSLSSNFKSEKGDVLSVLDISA